MFKDIKGVEVQKQPSSDFYSNFWLSCILIHENAAFTKTQFQEAMEADNIETRPLWKPMHLQPVCVDNPYYGDGFSESLFVKGLCLPSGSNLTIEEKNRIKHSIASLIK